MALKTSNKILLPRADRIRDPETKKVFQQLLNAIQKMNQTTAGDLTGLDERITVLEP